MKSNPSSEDSPYDDFHVLDLPLVNRRTDASTLIVLLTLLAQGRPRNFGQVVDDEICVRDLGKYDTFKSKTLTECELKNLRKGLRSLSSKLVVDYLTRIIGSSLDWLTAEEQELIWDLASVRLAERCGRTAVPDTVRDIEISGLQEKIVELWAIREESIHGEWVRNHFTTEAVRSIVPTKIELLEPSLTSDNLGLKTWGSSYILSNYLVSNPHLLQGKILELGSGTGLVGIVCCLLQKHVILTDLPEILENLKRNVDHNMLNGSIMVDHPDGSGQTKITINTSAAVHALDWKDPTPFIQEYREGGNSGECLFDTIILSDPVYSEDHPLYIVNMLRKFLRKNEGSKAIIQLPLREKFADVRSHLWNLMSEYFTKISEDQEKGYDDFGENTFSRSIWTWNNV